MWCESVLLVSWSRHAHKYIRSTIPNTLFVHKLCIKNHLSSPSYAPLPPNPTADRGYDGRDRVPVLRDATSCHPAPLQQWRRQRRCLGRIRRRVLQDHNGRQVMLSPPLVCLFILLFPIPTTCAALQCSCHGLEQYALACRPLWRRGAALGQVRRCRSRRVHLATYHLGSHGSSGLLSASRFSFR